MDKILYFNITYKCNSDCTFCAADNGVDDSNMEMTLDEFKNRISSQGLSKNDRVIINGGEPTVHKNFHEILEYANLHGAYLDLFTNGVKLHDYKFCERICKNVPMLIRIPVFGHNSETHDGLTGLKFSFEKIIKAFKNLSKLKEIHGDDLQLEAKLLVCKATYKNNSKIAEYLMDNIGNSIFFSVNPLLVSQRVARNSDEVLERYSTMIPETIKTIENIKKRGWYVTSELMPFCLFKDYDILNETIIPKNIEEYYNDPASSKEIRQNFTSKKCINCKYSMVCSGFPKNYINHFGDGEVNSMK